MTIEKLKEMEPLFDGWYVLSKLAEGKNSKVFKVSRTIGGEEQQMCIKTVKFPPNEAHLSDIIDSGKYQNVDEYLNVLENVIRTNMDKMLTLKTSENIVHFEDYTIIKENSCFYVMMLMEILTPLSRVLRLDAIEARQVIKIGDDMCNALSAFREKGIIHHNIKPENIYVDSIGNYKLGDFGVYEMGSDSNTQINSYTAPEIYRGENIDTNSDIYSLGIVLYKLLNNNRAPFLPDHPAPISLNDRDVAFSKLMRGETLPSPVNADYPLSKIIFKACAFDMSQRYLSPNQLKTDFCYYIENLQNNPIVSATQQRRNAQQAKAYHIEADNDYYFGSAKPVGSIRDTVSNRERENFQRTFDDEEEIEQDRNQKKYYYIILGLVVIIALVVALIVSNGKNDENDITTTNTTSAVSTSQVATTTAPQTTEETAIQETTTEETTTTEESTTEETTTEITTEETTTEITTEETTTEESTTEQTTEETTTTEPVSEEPTTEPILVFAKNEAGAKSEDGKTYVDILHYSKNADLEKGVFVIKIKDDLGNDPVVSSEVSVKIMYGDILIAPCTAQLTCKDNKDGTYTCAVKIVDRDYFYDELYQYYVCFEEGALVSDSMISLPLQVRVK